VRNPFEWLPLSSSNPPSSSSSLNPRLTASGLFVGVSFRGKLFSRPPSISWALWHEDLIPDNYEVVKVIIWSFMTCNVTLVNLIHENPRYKKMTPKVVLGKFLSHEMMVKDSKHKDDLAQGNVST
jgi:hypothetical protein